MQDLELVTAKQISHDILKGRKTPNRVLEDAKRDDFPEPLRNISKKPLVWNKQEIVSFYYPDMNEAANDQ